MQRTRSSLGTAILAIVVGLLVADGREAHAAFDHLQCFNVKDTAPRVTYTADVTSFVALGCTIKVPARMCCVPAEKTAVSPTSPGGGGTGTPNGFCCYKAKCPRTTAGRLVEDQFGSRNVAFSTTKYLCAPISGATTTTTSTTTTTLPGAFCCDFPDARGCAHNPDAPTSDCVNAGGTVAAAGTLCDGATGACVPPSGPGPCCQLFPGLCFGGPDWTEANCESSPGATFHPNAVCNTAGTCSP